MNVTSCQSERLNHCRRGSVDILSDLVLMQNGEHISALCLHWHLCKQANSQFREPIQLKPCKNQDHLCMCKGVEGNAWRTAEVEGGTVALREGSFSRIVPEIF